MSRSVVEHYWVPEVYGPSGRDLLEAFRASEEESWNVAGKVMDEPRKRDLTDLIGPWRAGQIRGSSASRDSASREAFVERGSSAGSWQGLAAQNQADVVPYRPNADLTRARHDSRC